MMGRQYKDSGIEWIGRIPKEWKLCQLKRSLSFQNGQDYKEIEANEGEGYPVYGSGGVFAYAKRYMYDGETVLFGRKGTIDRPLYVNGKFWAVDTMFYTIPQNGAECKYLYYVATTLPYFKYSTSTALPSMTQTVLGNMIIAIPPLPEQRRIADYLDKKCGEIDGLISLQEQMIQALTDYKQSVITEAVTKGLNPNARLVPSGIDWIGEMPEGWKITKVKYYGTIRSGESITVETLKDEGSYPVWGGNGLMGYAEQYNEDRTSIVIGRVGALCGNVRLLDSPTFVTDNALIFRLYNTVNAKYMLWLLRGANLNRLNTSNAQPLITGSKVKNVAFAFPPLAEQQSIASFLDEKCGEIDSLIALKRQKIDMLKDYRKSVIYEAVTGKTTIQ